MNREQDISRLISGELSDDQAAALRAEIDADPSLAELESSMRSLLLALPDLPSELDPPSELDQRILDTLLDPPIDKPAPARRWPWVAVATLAAALAIAIGPVAFQPSPPQTHLVRGVQHVRGDSTLYVGDLRIDVHGEANIFVEPMDPAARRSEQEDPMKPLPYLLSAAGGAIVTVAVLQGSAVVYGDGTDNPQTISEGQVHTARSAGGPTRTVVAPSEQPSAPQQLQQTSPEVTIADLERELQRVKLENSMLEGQIAARDGVAVDWPDDLPSALTPDAFEATLRAVADDVPHMSLDRVDCSEYPCLAVMSGQVPVEDGRDVAQQVQDSLQRRVGQGDDKLSARIGISQRNDGEGDVRMSLVIAPTPSSDGPDSGDLELRLQNRFNDAMQDDDGR